MRFSIIALLPLLSVLVAAIPVPDNASSQTANNLANGLNKGLDDSNKELDSINKLSSVEQNNPTAAETSQAEGGVKSALSTAEGQRAANQALNSRENAAVAADLDKVQAAQAKAQAAVDSFNGGSDDDATAASLKTTFEGGQRTLEGALGSAS